MVISSSSLQGPSLGLSVLLSLPENPWTDLLVPSGPESWEKVPAHTLYPESSPKPEPAGCPSWPEPIGSSSICPVRAGKPS